MEKPALYLHLIVVSLFFAVFILKLLLAVISILEINKNSKSSAVLNYDVLLSSSLAPQISILLPILSFPETLVDNISAFLSLNYSKYEVVIITDDHQVLTKLISLLFLEPSNSFSLQSIKTAKIKNIYKSRLISFSKITVVDKKSNGKFDALNAGLNICKGDYIIATDLSSLFTKEALLKLSKPIMDEIDYKVIAVRASKRVVNGNQIKRGFIEQIDISNSLIANIQMLSSLKEILLKKMAWSKFNSFFPLKHSISLISKADAIAVGGYRKNGPNKDLKLIYKIKRQLEIKGQKPKILAIADAICWFRVSENLHELIKQKGKSTFTGIKSCSGKLQSVTKQSRKNIVPVVNSFIWFVVDFSHLWLGISVIIAIIYLLLAGFSCVKILLFLTMTIYISSIFFTLLAILVETKFNTYLTKTQTKKLVQAMLLEPVILIPITIYAQLVAIVKKVFF